MILNIDKSFNPFPNEELISFESFTFSGGEPHIKINTDLIGVEQVVISQRVNSFNDFGLLLLAIDAVKRFNVKEINVFMPYFPAARQDRLMISGEPLSVKVYTEILNHSGVNKVYVYDAHSEVTPALLTNCINYDNHRFIEKIVDDLPKDLVLISPDGGALKKIYKVAKHLKSYEVVEASKSRDVKTGKLSGFQVYADDLQGRDCLIVDDICDGGGTFLGLAQELKKKNAGNLYLAISHGIFNKGFKSLEEFYSRIYVTDSFRVIENENLVKQIQISELI
jgi:ribose-phosphate pyrophosphokinase